MRQCLCFLRFLAFSALPARLNALLPPAPYALSAFIACIGLHSLWSPLHRLASLCIGLHPLALACIGLHRDNVPKPLTARPLCV